MPGPFGSSGVGAVRPNAGDLVPQPLLEAAGGDDGAAVRPATDHGGVIASLDREGQLAVVDSDELHFDDNRSAWRGRGVVTDVDVHAERRLPGVQVPMHGAYAGPFHDPDQIAGGQDSGSATSSSASGSRCGTVRSAGTT